MENLTNLMCTVKQSLLCSRRAGNLSKSTVASHWMMSGRKFSDTQVDNFLSASERFSLHSPNEASELRSSFDVGRKSEVGSRKSASCLHHTVTSVISIDPRLRLKVLRNAEYRDLQDWRSHYKQRVFSGEFCAIRLAKNCCLMK